MILSAKEAELLAEIGDRAERQNSDSSELINVVNDAVREVFSTMCEIDFGTDQEVVQGKPDSRLEISGVISISGTVDAIVVINMDRSLAIAATEALLGDAPSEICDDVIETVAELANMVGGNAKDRIKQPGCNLGLPTVVHGTGHIVAMPGHMQFQLAKFECAAGSLNLELCSESKSN